ncbi:MAG TPA: hypothetical protein VGA61_03290 [Anaerolineae bacterium]
MIAALHARGGRWVMVTPTVPEYQAVAQGLRSRPGSDPIELRRSGIGPARAAALAASLSADLENGADIAGIALLGWAGGLTADLRPGGVVIASCALFGDRPVIPCRPVILPGAAGGPILTVPAVLRSATAKAAAATSGALAVEMEAYPLAAWAHTHGLPFVHARVILDVLDEPLPDLAGIIDHTGRARPLRLLRACVARPNLLPELWRFTGRIRLANARLTALAAAIPDALEV